MPTARVAVRGAYLGLALCAALAPAAAIAQSPMQSAFTSLTVFGDSYSDTGNVFRFTTSLGIPTPPSPPYYNGRFSNGPVWVDYFAQAIGRPNDAIAVYLTPQAPNAAAGNYAIGGARTYDTQVTIGTNTITLPGTGSQIADYFSRAGVGRADPTGLYALFVGGDDLRDIAALTDPAARQAQAAATANNVITQASALAANGARNVLLFTLPSIGVLPEQQAIPGRGAIDDAITSTFNSTLAAGILGLQANLPGSTFFDLRLDNLFGNIESDALAGGARYGITNLGTPCFFPGAPSCASSLFTDDMHPTTQAQQLIAQAAYTYVTTGANVAAVPEPATVALVGGGLGVVAVLRTRRRRAA